MLAAFPHNGRIGVRQHGRPRVFWNYLLVFLLIPLCAQAGGLVVTMDDRLTGDVRLEAGQVHVGEKTVPFTKVIYVKQAERGRTLLSSPVVYLRNGEVWCAQIHELRAGTVTVESDLWGKTTLDLMRVMGFEFLRRRSPGDLRDAETLYRESGEPIPGKMLWIDGEHIAMSSPLGVLKLKRAGAVAYLFRRVPLEPAEVQVKGCDEIRLVDGSVLHGVVSFGKDGLTLNHPTVGEVTIPSAAWRSVTRRRASWISLGEIRASSVEAHGLVLPTPPARPYYAVRGDLPGAPRHDYLTSLRVLPRCTLSYTISWMDARTGGKLLRLRALVGMTAGSKGDATFRVVAAGETLFERELTAGSARVPLDVAIPETRRFSLAVDFGKRLRFPCEVELADPLVVTAGEK